jgi:spore germination protein
MFIYLVRPGDTLWSIAKKFNVSLQELIDLNQLPDNNKLVPGMALLIPAKYHTVMPGETLYEISRLYGLTVEQMVRANNIANPNYIISGSRLVVPQKPRPPIYVNGFIYTYGENAVPIVREHGDLLTYLSPFAYLIKEDGTLQTIYDGPAIQAAEAENVTPMMAVTNFSSTSRGINLAHVVLSDTAIVDKIISNIIDVMKQKGYRGLNVDFENVLPEDRENYNRFMQTAVGRLHPLGYFVSAALAPKTSATQAGLLYEAHDYAAHGRIDDFVILMTYEWGYRKGPARAISPLDEIRRVLDYAVTVIPRNKIFFGFQLYARDWTLPFVEGTSARTFSAQEAVRIATERGSPIQYDYTAQSPYFEYADDQGRLHEVWFEDARSAQAKFDTVKGYGLAGISYWALGYPFPQNWVLLDYNFTVRKKPISV